MVADLDTSISRPWLGRFGTCRMTAIFRRKYSSSLIMPSSLTVRSSRCRAIDGSPIRTACRRMLHVSQLNIPALHTTCDCCRYGVCLWWFVVISPPVSNGQVSGTSNSKQANATLDFNLSLFPSSGHDARMGRRSPVISFASARHRATSSRLSFSSYSLSHLLRSRRQARASSPSM